LENILSSRLHVSSIYRATGPGIGDYFYIIYTAVNIQTLAQYVRSFKLANAQGYNFSAVLNTAPQTRALV